MWITCYSFSELKGCFRYKTQEQWHFEIDIGHAAPQDQLEDGLLSKHICSKCSRPKKTSRYTSTVNEIVFTSSNHNLIASNNVHFQKNLQTDLIVVSRINHYLTTNANLHFTKGLQIDLMATTLIIDHKQPQNCASVVFIHAICLLIINI